MPEITSKALIAFISLIFILSSFWLFQSSNNYNDPNYQKNWWGLEFSDPKSNQLDFVIENHSDRTDFHYEILEEQIKVAEKDLQIKKGMIEKIEIKEIFENKKITIRVISGEEKREIYKNALEY